MVQYTSTKAISTVQQNFYLGNCYSQSGLINTTNNLGSIGSNVYYKSDGSIVASAIYNGSGTQASVILIGIDGSYNYFRDLQEGEIVRFKHIGVASSATFTIISTGATVTLSSDATYMVWLGGES